MAQKKRGRSMKRVLAIAAFGALALVLAAGPAAGGYVTVYGPSYDSSTGTGYILSIFPGYPGIGVSDAGTAMGFAEKYVSGVHIGGRAIRWDASGAAATELGNLGTDSSGSSGAKANAINDSGPSRAPRTSTSPASTWAVAQ
jgi:hypothetical protein